MESRKFSLDDIIILNKCDTFDDGKLSKIIGGNNDRDMGCTCKCDSGNCYEDDGSPFIPV